MKTRSKRLLAGYGTAHLVPPLPFPLAGTVHREDRLSGWVDDPPQATVVTLTGSETSVALVGLDILIVDDTLYADIAELAGEHGIDHAFVYASHTHSAMGGFLDSPGGRFFMGRYQPALRDFLLEQTAAALASAVADAAPVTAATTGRGVVPGLTMNRRRRHGPTDDSVLYTELTRGKNHPLALVGVSGHPVIACFMDPSVVSADYPGRVRHALLGRGKQPLIMPGALGGLNTIFPEMPTNMQDHLTLVENLITGGVDQAIAAGRPVDLSTPLAVGREPLAFTQSTPPFSGGPPTTALRSMLSNAIGKAYARFTAPQSVSLPTMVVAVGDVMLAGMPADFGVAPTLLLRDHLERGGAQTAYVVSHANGYVGYLHLREEAAWQPTSNAGMHHYENAMAWYGRDATERLIAAALKVQERL